METVSDDDQKTYAKWPKAYVLWRNELHLIQKTGEEYKYVKTGITYGTEK